MKKYLFILAAAAALAACSKTEVVPVNSDADVEITFLTAPLTKALGTGQSAFSTNNVFQSAAFYDAYDFVYGSNTAQAFIKPTTVKYFTSVWKAADASGNEVTYYWPKDGGKLSFFSWSLNKTTLNYGTGTTAPDVAINVTNGVVLNDYSVTNNEDFMVAEPALDQTGNKETYTHEGVPTLFKHKLANVAVKAVTKDNYASDPLNQTFTINSISFLNTASEATYKQYVSTNSKDVWEVSDSGEVTYFSGEQVITYNNGTAQDVAKSDGAVDLYIPETYLASTATNPQTFKVVYTVSRTGSTASGSVTKSTQYTKTISMKDLLGDAIVGGKKYTITLTFGLDQIYWDPAVEDWTDGTSGSIDIK